MNRLDLPPPARILATASCNAEGIREANSPVILITLRFTQPSAIGLKLSDEFTVSLCRGDHRQLHHASNEVVGWENLKLESFEIADGLWEQSHAIVQSKIDG